MLPNKTLSETLYEIYRKYPKAIEEMIEHLARMRAEESLIGETTDETLQRVYKNAGYLSALKEIKEWFEHKV